jgi:mRNA interferase HigB
VRIIAKKTLKVFWEKHKDCKQQLKSWYDETLSANWTSTKDIKTNYPSASFLNDNRVVFNIKGNSYQLIVKINYKYKMVWIRFVVTHAQYDRIDATSV